MTIDIFTTDWTNARKKIAGWQRPERALDIFAGTTIKENAVIEGVKVTRLTVQPAAPDNASDLVPVSKSYAVAAEAKVDWRVDPDTSKSSKPLNDLAFAGFAWLQASAGRFDIHFDLPEKLRCLGLGERFSDLNLRGTVHTLFATDNPHHNEHADMLYKSIPFLILADGANYRALWIDTPAPQRWDLDSELTGAAKVEIFTRRGFYIYTFAQSTLPALVAAFTHLTGRAPLPPLWSLGHQQCRWSYPDEATIRELASQFRRRRIPCDTLVLDIDYMDEYRVFTSSKERFPSFDKLAAELAPDNFKLITIVDPGVKKDEKFQIYKEAISADHLCKTAQGEVFIETVWPGLSAFPDFLDAKTRRWWGEKLKFYMDRGIAGIWNDMNEPAMFNNQTPLPRPFLEMPENDRQLFLQKSEEGPIGHFEVRNLYGFMMSLATQAALLAGRPGERPFVLTRAASTGIQRHAAVWLGDNISWYEHLQKSLPMLLNIGLSGVTFAGVDIGGFGGDTSPELLVRWYEMGVFYPFFRNHCALMGRAQEPFSFSPRVESLVRHLIEMRYRLLPYIQNLFWEHGRSGAPLMRPLAWHYSDDALARECEDQFMFGPDLMVAPVVRSNQRSRLVYFPAGRWFAFDIPAGAVPIAYSGGQMHRVNCPLGKLPAFVRDGAILPLADIMQSTAEYQQSTITFYAYGPNARGVYFEDDGQTLDYTQGAYSKWSVSMANGDFVSECLHNGFAASEHQYKWSLVSETGQAAPVVCQLK